MNPLVMQLPGVLIGELAGVDSLGHPLVQWQKSPPKSAQVAWMPSPPEWSRCAGRRVLLGFVDGDEESPFVLGLLDPPPEPPKQAGKAPRVLRLESRDELVIECGKSKIALRADGRIEIRGGHLVSRSSGPNKIKGASVYIN